MGGIWGSIFETYLYYFPISDYMLLRFCYQQLQQSDVTYCIIYTCVRFTWNNIVWYPQLSAMSFYLINTFIHLHKFIIETIYMYRHVSLGSTFITLLLQLANFYPPVYLFNAHPNPTSLPPPPPPIFVFVQVHPVLHLSENFYLCCSGLASSITQVTSSYCLMATSCPKF